MLLARQFLHKSAVARGSRARLFARKMRVLNSLSSSLEYRLRGLN